MKKLILVSLIGSSIMSAASSVTCAEWQTWGSDFQLGYALGMDNTYSLIYIGNKDFKHPFKGITHRQVIDGITDICKTPENGRLELMFVAFIFYEKLNGSSQKEIDKDLENLRKYSSGDQ